MSELGGEEEEAWGKLGEPSRINNIPNRTSAALDEDDLGHECMHGVFDKRTTIQTSMSISLFSVVNTCNGENTPL